MGQGFVSGMDGRAYSKSSSHDDGRGQRDQAGTLFVSSLEKGFRVLEAFREAPGDLGITEVALRTGLNKSAAQRFTNTLYQLGYLEKDARSRRYRPALRLMDLSYTFLHQNRLAEIAVVRLIDASKIYSTTVNLCEMINTDIIYTVRIPHSRASYPATVPGRRMPAFSTSGGTVILAFRPAGEVASIIAASERRAITSNTITDVDAITGRIEEARDQGYGFGVGQALPQEISVAAPVLDSRGYAVAAVQVPVYLPQWSVEEARAKIAPLVMETARSISGVLASES